MTTPDRFATATAGISGGAGAALDADAIEAVRAAIRVLDAVPPTVVGSRCFYCPAPASLLCDGILGWRRVWCDTTERTRPRRGLLSRMPVVSTGYWAIDAKMDGVMVTCDRPLCDEHAMRAGVWFFDGNETGHDTTDHCADCVEMVAGRQKPPLLSDEELGALARRRLLRKHAHYETAPEVANALRVLLDSAALHPKSERPESRTPGNTPEAALTVQGRNSEEES